MVLMGLLLTNRQWLVVLAPMLDGSVSCHLGCRGRCYKRLLNLIHKITLLAKLTGCKRISIAAKLQANHRTR